MRRQPTARGIVLLQAMLAVVVMSALVVSPARAITVGTPTTTLTSNVAGIASTYTFAGYTTKKNRPLRWADVTFPAGTDVSNAVAVLPNTTVAATGPTTVRVTYSPAIAGSTAFTVAVGGILNPPAGAYPVNSVTIVCRTTNNGGAQIQDDPAQTEGYTIVATPFITLTIATPDAGQSVDFGAIDPGVTTTAKQVTISVTSSAPYTLTRTIAGDVTPLGLLVTGAPSRAGGAGSATYSDGFTLSPPWTTDPGVPLVATVTYTAIQ